jgi:polyisoprenoid-binding protein YceI
MRRAKGAIHVFTFKEGLLSSVAHDLRIRLEKFDITLDGEAIRCDFDLSSLHVDGPVENGEVNLNGYDASKRADVERAMRNDVLHTDKHPTASFTGLARPKGGGFTVSGSLALAGRQAPLEFEVKNGGNTYKAQIELQPSRWGVEQYKALLGAIRLKDMVRIEFVLSDA